MTQDQGASDKSDRAVVNGAGPAELHSLGLTTIVWSGLMLNDGGEQVKRLLEEEQGHG